MTDTIIVEAKKSINWVNLLLFVGCIILSFMLWRGCENSKHQLAENNNLKKINERHITDSIHRTDTIKLLRRDTARTNEAIVDINFNAAILEDSLNRSEINTAFLAHRIKKLVSTLTTKVDTIELTNNCEDVADAYLAELDINKAFRRSKDSLQKVMQLRIAYGDSLARIWESGYNNCKSDYHALAAAASALRMTWKVKIGPTGIYSPFVVGAGAMMAYENKKGTDIITSVLHTNHGLLYQGGLLWTISLRKK